MRRYEGQRVEWMVADPLRNLIAPFAPQTELGKEA
jgi:hypothetical protein